MHHLRSKYIGSRAFYMEALTLALPLIVQNLITNLVSMLDNIMVGSLGTAPMTGVSIVNQYIFVFNLTVFGGLSGASIFGTQFFGKRDPEGQKYTVRFRLYIAVGIILAFAVVFGLLGPELIRLFLSDSAGRSVSAKNARLAAETLEYGERYLRIIIFSMIPFALGQVYATAIRECGETRIPMIGAMAAIVVNLFLDYGLIFGHFGMPCLGVEGAAIATVVAKCCEAAVIIVWAHTHPARNPYIPGLYRSFRIPGYLTREMIIKGLPLLVNELLWSTGLTVISQCYSARGEVVVSARSISSVLINLFSVFYLQIGQTAGIMLGQLLGAGKMKEARDTDNKLLVFGLVLSLCITLGMMPVAHFFPLIYNTEPEVRTLASYLIFATAFAIPIFSFTNISYFTLRSGGKTGITFLFDFGFSWLVQIPLALFLAYRTKMEIHTMYVVVTYVEGFKAVIGLLLIRSDIWIVNIVNREKKEG